MPVARQLSGVPVAGHASEPVSELSVSESSSSTIGVSLPSAFIRITAFPPPETKTEPPGQVAVALTEVESRPLAATCESETRVRFATPDGP